MPFLNPKGNRSKNDEEHVNIVKKKKSFYFKLKLESQQFKKNVVSILDIHSLSLEQSINQPYLIKKLLTEIMNYICTIFVLL